MALCPLPKTWSEGCLQGEVLPGVGKKEIRKHKPVHLYREAVNSRPTGGTEVTSPTYAKEIGSMREKKETFVVWATENQSLNGISFIFSPQNIYECLLPTPCKFRCILADCKFWYIFFGSQSFPPAPIEHVGQFSLVFCSPGSARSFCTGKTWKNPQCVNKHGDALHHCPSLFIMQPALLLLLPFHSCFP